MNEMNFKGINVGYEEIDANPELGFNFPFIILFPKNINANPNLIYACNLPDNYSNNASTFDELQELTKNDFDSIDPLTKHISLESGNILMVPFVPRFNKFRPNFLGRDCFLNDFDKYKDSKFYESINKYINLADQHKAIINESIKIIRDKGYMIDDKAIICGYSEGAKFASHLALLHPEIFKAVIAGGTGGIISMPIKNIGEYVFNYPNGIADVKNFDFDSFKDIAFFYYMGDKDKCDSAMPKFEPHKIINEKGEEDYLKDECNNLTVFIDENGRQHFLLADDGNYMAANSLYSDSEVNTINKALGTVIQDRFKKQEEIYNVLNLNSTFKLYADVNHRTIFDKREELFNDVDEFLQDNLQLDNKNNIVFSSEHIDYIKMNKKYIDDYLNMYNNKEMQMVLFGKEKEFTKEQIENWITKVLNENSNTFTMIEKGTNDFIGTIEIMNIKDESGEPAITITPNKQGYHYGTEAMKAIIEYGYKNLGLKTINLNVHKSNLKAIHLYENTGFVQDEDNEESIHMRHSR